MYDKQDEEIKEHFAEEKRIADGLISELHVLRDSSYFDAREAWEAVMKYPELEKLKHSEYFAYAFLRFRESCIQKEISYDFHTGVFIPLIEEWCGYWPETELSRKLDSILKKHYIKQKLDALENKRGILSVLYILSVIIGIIAMVVFRSVSSTANSNVAIEYFSRRYYASLGWIIMFAFIAFICTAVNVLHLLWIRKMTKNDVHAKIIKRHSGFVIGARIIVMLVVAIGASLLLYRSSVRWSEDLAQIKEDRLSVGTSDVLSNMINAVNIRTGKVLVRIGTDYKEFMVLPGLEFDFEGGAKTYIIGYTYNHKIVVSIKEAW